MAAIKLGLSLLALVAGALIVVTAGVVGWVVVPNVIYKKIKEETRLALGTETWDKWKDITIPIQLKFYIYNITNPNANVNEEKLDFQEVGPYVYNEIRTKNVTNIADSGEEVTYHQTISYFFDQEASGDRKEDDLFNIPNFPLIAVANGAHGQGPLKTVIGIILTGQGERLVRQNVAARELLFDGFKLTPGYNLAEVADFEGLRFGFYRGKNESNDGEYVVKTGLKNHTFFGQISTWENKTELDWWYTKDLDKDSNQHYCNKINGSDGSLFPPFNSKETILRVFNTEICRSIFLTYNSEITYKDIPGYKFTIPFEMFQHPDDNEDNRCFCPSPSASPSISNDCGQSIIRIFPCKHGAPVVTSNPHFLDAQPVVFEPITIAKPDRELHETYFEIEPDSGMVLRISKKIQINVEVQPLPDIKLFQDLNFTKFTKARSVLLPIFWADESVALDDVNAEDLYDKLIKPQKMVNIAKWVVIGIGGVLTLVGIIGVFMAARK